MDSGRGLKTRLIDKNDIWVVFGDFCRENVSVVKPMSNVYMEYGDPHYGLTS